MASETEQTLRRALAERPDHPLTTLLERYLRERREAARTTLERADDNDLMKRAQGKAREADAMHYALFGNRSE